jgi:hypothetical protein
MSRALSVPEPWALVTVDTVARRRFGLASSPPEGHRRGGGGGDLWRVMKLSLWLRERMLSLRLGLGLSMVYHRKCL